MGERFAGDLRELCDIARPDTGVITNVGLAHAEHLGGRDGVIAVLAELLEALPGHGHRGAERRRSRHRRAARRDAGHGA